MLRRVRRAAAPLEQLRLEAERHSMQQRGGDTPIGEHTREAEDRIVGATARVRARR